MSYHELQVGQSMKHAMRRSVTETDNVLLTAITCNPAAIHLDEDYCSRETAFGTRIVNSCVTMGLITGLAISEGMQASLVADLGMDAVRFPKPVFHGDTLRSETEVVGKRDSASRPDQGIVTLIHRGFNQNDDLVFTCHRTVLMFKEPA